MGEGGGGGRGVHNLFRVEWVGVGVSAGVLGGGAHVPHHMACAAAARSPAALPPPSGSCACMPPRRCLPTLLRLLRVLRRREREQAERAARLRGYREAAWMQAEQEGGSSGGAGLVVTLHYITLMSSEPTVLMGRICIWEC